MVSTYKNSIACSAFTIKNKSQLFMFKSYDWYFGEGVLMFNPSGMDKVSSPVAGNHVNLHWTSKYSNLTFNQYGQNLPNGGMNEEGLTIEVLWLECSEYPNVNGEKSLNELQWIQYSLDNFKNVDELIQSTEDIIVTPFYAKAHYYITDATGKSAVVEYINGKRIVSLGNKLPYPAITNSTYKNSLTGFESQNNGCLRFNKICNSLNKLPDDLSREAAYTQGFDVLNKVREGDHTKWQIAYDLKNKEICFRTTANPTIKTIKIDDFKKRKTKPLYIDLDSPSPLIINNFKTVGISTSNDLLKHAFEKLKIPVPSYARWIIAFHLKTGKANNYMTKIVNKFKSARRL